MLLLRKLTNVKYFKEKKGNEYEKKRKKKRKKNNEQCHFCKAPAAHKQHIQSGSLLPKWRRKGRTAVPTR